MKDIMKNNILRIFLILALLLVVLSNFCYAEEVKGLGIGDLDKYQIKNEKGYEKVSQKAGAIWGIIQVIGSVLAVIIIIVIGIKYMVGSVEQKAEYKKTFMLYIIGAVLLFAGSFIPKLIYDLTTQAIN